MTTKKYFQILIQDPIAWVLMIAWILCCFYLVGCAPAYIPLTSTTEFENKTVVKQDTAYIEVYQVYTEWLGDKWTKRQKTLVGTLPITKAQQ